MSTRLHRDIKGREQPARLRILQNIQSGIEYTYFANQIYTNEECSYGNRVSPVDNRVIRKMIMNEELEIKNTRIKIKTEDG